MAERLGLWWVPFLLALAPAAGFFPGHRDLVDFFAPMRAATAAALAAGEIPWLNLANGCGEAWFANPETGVLYPPVWLHLTLPAPWALSLEIAFHLAWLSLGVGLVARHLGAGPLGRLVAEAAAWSAGPVLFTVGVLNNLETLAWVPWMVLAARAAGRGTVFAVAATTAFAWLGGEPQIWALAAVLTVAVARSRARAVMGLALGASVVLVQLVPFVVWVLEGDRGPQAAAWVLRGALGPADWGGLLVPGLAADPGRMVYLESLFLGAPLLACALIGGRRRPWLLAAAAGLGLLATLPELGGGGMLLTLTGGLVRYPSRFALLGLALLLPLIGEGAEDWLAGRGRWLATAVAVPTVALCMAVCDPWRWLVAGAPAVLMLWGAAVPARRGLRAAALAWGLLGAVAVGAPLLGLQPVAVLEGEAAWAEARDDGRLYTPAPSGEVVQWLATGLEARRLWPVGYLNLSDGLNLVRTDAPVANRRLVRHLETADQGPRSRWWLDSLAARWVVLREEAPVPKDMDEVRALGGMRLLYNRTALPEILLASGPPVEDRYPQPAGDVSSLRLSGNSCRAVFETPTEAWLWVSVAPVRGWRWSIEGAPVELQQGPGILQSLPVAAGRHELVGRYRPPGLVPLAAISMLAAFATVIGLWRARRRLTRSAATPEAAASRDSSHEIADA
jgi:hypothetical protein